MSGKIRATAHNMKGIENMSYYEEKVLKLIDEDTKVYLRFDNGYTFGSITEDNFNNIDE